MQDEMRPMSDIFGSSKETMGSMVVIPLFWHGHAEGGLYFTTRTPVKLDAMKGPILALARQVKDMLHQEPGCSLQAIRDFAHDAVVGPGV